MFRKVTALRFDGAISNGRNKACFINCVAEDGSRLDVVVKFSGCEGKAAALIREAVTAFLAADLGLKVPEPLLVEVSPMFQVGSASPEHHDLINNSSRHAFGSLKLAPGYQIVMPRPQLPLTHLEPAAEIFAFDTLVANIDRTPKNPNCLTNGQHIAVIDHDLAFITEGVLFWLEPWKQDGGLALADSEKHVLWDSVRRKNATLNNMQEKMKEITPERVQQYRDALPPDWIIEAAASGFNIDGLFNYILQLIENRDKAFTEITRALS